MKTVVGTPGYIAPESLIDASYTTGSDIYAVGVCIYTMLGKYLQKFQKMQFQKCRKKCFDGSSSILHILLKN